MHLFRHKLKPTCLSDEPVRWISKLFDIHRPTYRWRWRLGNEPLIVPPHLSPATKMGGLAYHRSGNQALETLSNAFSRCTKAMYKFSNFSRFKYLLFARHLSCSWCMINIASIVSNIRKPIAFREKRWQLLFQLPFQSPSEHNHIVLTLRHLPDCRHFFWKDW